MELWMKAMLCVYMLCRLKGLCKPKFLRLFRINNREYMTQTGQTYIKIAKGCERSEVSFSNVLRLALILNVLIFLSAAYLSKEFAYVTAVTIFLIGIMYETFFVTRFYEAGFEVEQLSNLEITGDRIVFFSYYVMYVWSAVALFLSVL